MKNILISTFLISVIFLCMGFLIPSSLTKKEPQCPCKYPYLSGKSGDFQSYIRTKAMSKYYNDYHKCPVCLISYTWRGRGGSVSISDKFSDDKSGSIITYCYDQEGEIESIRIH